jgi:hypothetical protein|uniref:Nocturnin n=1 Tax=Eutreptiella gymnastica TaxID=73025 RepID=A0A7S4D1P1_9EUGL|mmetsp:Transcript_66745/g.111826  ORF Transcript_66745/g.111826 Transcript_66745/m.111826 type:complete len:165 (-) Transcript_66745:481-975(-)
MMPGYDDRLQQDAASFFPSGNSPPPAHKMANNKSRSQTDTEVHLQLILRFIHRAQLSVLGIQEPHLKDDGVRSLAQSDLKKQDFALCTNLSFSGKGGAAITFRKDWTWGTGWSLSPRIMHATLRDDQGLGHSFLVTQPSGKSNGLSWPSSPPSFSGKHHPAVRS